MTADANASSPPQEEANTDPLKGIGGWLVLLGIGQVVGIYKTMVFFIQFYANPETIAASHQLPNAMNGETTLNGIYFAVAIFTAYAFFTQKKYLPILFTVEVVLTACLPVLDALWVSITTTATFDKVIDPGGVGRSIGTSIIGLIWVAYLFLSKRAKKTFVN